MKEIYFAEKGEITVTKKSLSNETCIFSCFCQKEETRVSSKKTCPKICLDVLLHWSCCCWVVSCEMLPKMFSCTTRSCEAMKDTCCHFEQTESNHHALRREKSHLWTFPRVVNEAEDKFARSLARKTFFIPFISLWLHAFSLRDSHFSLIFFFKVQVHVSLQVYRQSSSLFIAL